MALGTGRARLSGICLRTVGHGGLDCRQGRFDTVRFRDRQMVGPHYNLCGGSVMVATVCSFKRQQGDNTEMGIAVGTDEAMSCGGDYSVSVIIDKEGRAVPSPIFDYTLQPEYGCFAWRADA